MSKRHLRSFVLSGVLSLGLCASAFADTENWSLTGSTFSGSGTITLTQVGSTDVYQVTGLTGTYTSTADDSFGEQTGFIGPSGSIGLPASAYDASTPDVYRYPDGTLGYGGYLLGGKVVSYYDDLFTPKNDSGSCDNGSGYSYTPTSAFDDCGLLFTVTAMDGSLYAVDLVGDGSGTDVIAYSGLVTPGAHSTTDAGDGFDYTAGTFTLMSASAATPEPGSLALLGTGLLGVAGVARRRFRKV